MDERWWFGLPWCDHRPMTAAGHEGGGHTRRGHRLGGPGRDHRHGTGGGVAPLPRQPARQTASSPRSHLGVTRASWERPSSSRICRRTVITISRLARGLGSKTSEVLIRAEGLVESQLRSERPIEVDEIGLVLLKKVPFRHQCELADGLGAVARDHGHAVGAFVSAGMPSSRGPLPAARGRGSSGR
jgi:hypothetical protein